MGGFGSLCEFQEFRLSCIEKMQATAAATAEKNGSVEMKTKVV